MINKDKITEIINEYLSDSDKFLVQARVNPRNNKVMVFLDGDSGVAISDCAKLSRHIESFFDREEEDFELEVSSVGVGTPLTMVRQYRNNIGRLIQLTGPDDTKLRGKLVEVLRDGIQIEEEIPKKGKRKKEPDTDKEKLCFVPFADIREAKIQPSYK